MSVIFLLFKRELFKQEFGFNSMTWDGGFKYSMKNCLYESVLEKIVENCKCKPVFVNFKLKVNSFDSIKSV